MKLHVTDSSAFGPFLFADEHDARIDGLEQLIFRGECMVPAHWRLEVANQLLMGLRRQRTTEPLAAELLAMVQALPVLADTETGDRMAEIYHLAVNERLTIYDAAYLELAIRIEGVLVTFDKKLRAAATLHGVPLLP